jgi:hypothetical protein
MRLLTKLLKLRAAIDSVLTEFEEDAPQEEEAEILLTRSAKNRRSDENEVMTMVPLNRGTRSINGDKNRALLVTILEEYEPMTRPEIWATARELEPRVRDSVVQMKNLQQMVNRMVRVGQLTLNTNGILGMGA